MQAFYADQFVLPLPEGHRFPMAKYQLLRDRLRAAQPDIQRGAKARVVAPNAAARRVSRLNARIKAMS